MADINDVLERLITDPGFRRQLHEDRAKALEGYDLTADDHEMLAAQLTDGGGDRRVEQRTSKSAFAGLASELFSGMQSPGVEPASPVQPQQSDTEFLQRSAGDDADESEYPAIKMENVFVTSVSPDEQPGPDDIATEDPGEQPAAEIIGLTHEVHAPRDAGAAPDEDLPTTIGSVPNPDTPTGDASAGQAGYDDYIEIDSFSWGASQGADDPFSFAGSSADGAGATASPVPEEIAADAEPENTRVAMETVSLNYEEVKVSDEEGGAAEELAGSAPAPDDDATAVSQSGEYVVTSATHDVNAESDLTGDNPADRSADPDDSSDSD